MSDESDRASLLARSCSLLLSPSGMVIEWLRVMLCRCLRKLLPVYPHDIVMVLFSSLSIIMMRLCACYSLIDVDSC